MTGDFFSPVTSQTVDTKVASELLSPLRGKTPFPFIYIIVCFYYLYLSHLFLK